MTKWQRKERREQRKRDIIYTIFMAFGSCLESHTKMNYFVIVHVEVLQFMHIIRRFTFVDGDLCAIEHDHMFRR